MPKKETIERAREDREAGKAPSTQAGEFIREELEKFKAGDPAIKSRKQAIAIGLSEARRTGVDVPPPEPGTTSERTRHKAERDEEVGKEKGPLAKDED